MHEKTWKSKSRNGHRREISSWTVNTYLRRIFAKLGVTSRAAMVARLMR
jgi:two-component system, NarL family, nitrate/nitrite response regulator NarL